MYGSLHCHDYLILFVDRMSLFNSLITLFRIFQLYLSILTVHNTCHSLVCVCLCIYMCVCVIAFLDQIKVHFHGIIARGTCEMKLRLYQTFVILLNLKAKNFAIDPNFRYRIDHCHTSNHGWRSCPWTNCQSMIQSEFHTRNESIRSWNTRESQTEWIHSVKSYYGLINLHLPIDMHRLRKLGPEQLVTNRRKCCMSMGWFAVL